MRNKEEVRGHGRGKNPKFKDFSRSDGKIQGVFKEKSKLRTFQGQGQNSRTFQGQYAPC